MLPLSSPVPPSPETSQALMAAFAERNIEFIPGRRVASRRSTPRGSQFSMTGPRCRSICSSACRSIACPTSWWRAAWREDGWIPVNPRTLETRFAECLRGWRRRQHGHPKGRRVRRGRRASGRERIDRQGRGTRQGRREYDGFGTCYIEFGGGRIGKVEVDFFSGPKPTGTYHEPSLALRADKESFGSSRRARWFGM